MTVMMISLIIILIVLLSTYNINGFKHIYTNKVMTRLNAYCLNVNLYIKPERRDEFLQVIKQNAQGARTNEPKCRLYVYGESITATNTFHFQEIYDDKDGFLQHTSSPHFKIWKAFADSDPFTKPPSIVFFEADD